MPDTPDLRWLIARELPSLRRFAVALTRDREEADDLVQDALERGLRKRHLWARKGSLRSWLFRVLYTVHLNNCRPTLRSRAETLAADELPPIPVAPRQEDRLELRQVAEALQRLPRDQRDPLLLVALEGMAYDEAASVLGIPVGTLRSRLSRGRDALRDLLVGDVVPVDAEDEVPARPALRRVK